MIYPKVVEIPKDMLRPVLTGYVQTPTGSTKDLTGLVSCKFFLFPIGDDGVLGTVKINGADGTIADATAGKLTYAWAGSDTDTVGRYASYFIGYWGAGSTVPEMFIGPEVVVYTPGTRLSR